jgi:SAM-dependent methyltransferase
MKITQDAYGQQLLAQFNSQIATAEIIERDDHYIGTGSEAGIYFQDYKQWTPLERRAIKLAKGRVLDIGCGAGRHSLYLQQKGFDVTGIDISPGAVKVCKLRGLKKAFVRPIADIDKFKPDSFDTILMLGNNFVPKPMGSNSPGLRTRYECPMIARLTTRSIRGDVNFQEPQRHKEHKEFFSLCALCVFVV